MNLQIVRAVIAVAASVVAVACGGMSGNIAPAPPGTVPEAGSVAGTYNSSFGTTVFSEAGGKINATYPGGTVSCTATGADLQCDWTEASTRGKAHLTRLSDGSIRGTWGKGASSTDGGRWEMARDPSSVPVAAAAPAAPVAAATGSCQKDNDCEGDLVCNNGQCKPL